MLHVCMFACLHVCALCASLRVISKFVIHVIDEHVRSVDVACFLLHAACCMLHAACCTLHAARCMLHAARCMLHAARCTLHAACCMLHVACCMLHATTRAPVARRGRALSAE